MKDDYGSEYLATNYEFLAIGCRLISNMYNFSIRPPRGWSQLSVLAILILLQPGGTTDTSSLICRPVLPTRHSTHLAGKCV